MARCTANYLTVLGYPDHAEWQDYWPADVQDWQRYFTLSCGYMACDVVWAKYLITQKLLVHGFINIGGAKISKSVGNVVDPVEIIDGYGADAFRHFFARHILLQDDGDFTLGKVRNRLQYRAW